MWVKCSNGNLVNLDKCGLVKIEARSADSHDLVAYNAYDARHRFILCSGSEKAVQKALTAVADELDIKEK